MKISNYIYTIIVVSAVFFVMYGFLGQLASEEGYNIEVDDSYKKTYDKINDTTANLKETQNRILNISAKEDTGFFTGTWDTFIITKEVIFGTIGLTKDSISIGTDLMWNFMSDTGMEVGYYLFGFLLVGIVGGLIFLLLKREY